jgi:hypothetical protein
MRFSFAVAVFGSIVAASPAITTERSYDKDLQNCKALLADIYPNETVVHLECTDVADINIAIVQMAKITGVTAQRLWF